MNELPELLVDLAHGPIGAPEWHDISGELRSGVVSRGRSRELDRVQAGTATLTLNNRTRQFDPMFRDGPHFGNVRPMRRLRIRARWRGTIYPLFLGYTTSWTQNYVAGTGESTCTVSLADAFSVLNGRTVSDVWLQLDGRTPLGQVSFIDFDGMLSGARVNAILDLVAWVDGREIDPGVSKTLPSGLSAETLQIQLYRRNALPGEELANFPGGTPGVAELQLVDLTGSIVGEPSPLTALELLQLIELSEGGFLFVKADGSLRFKDRHASLNADPVATFGDVFPELPYTAISLTEGDEQIRNDATVTRAGGLPQIATDPPSIDEFGERSYDLTGLLLTSDLETLSRAEFIVNRYAQPWSRIDRLSVVPAIDPERLWPEALGRELGDGLLIRRRPQGIPPPVELECRLEGIEHRFAPMSWETTWGLSPSDAAAADGSPTRWLQLDRTPLETSRLAW